MLRSSSIIAPVARPGRPCHTISNLLLLVCILASPTLAETDLHLHFSYKDEYLTISGADLPGKEVKIHYIEAYCRPGSTNRQWNLTTIGHQTRLISADDTGKRLVLESALRDGVIVRHEITAAADEVSFNIAATNPTDKPSEAQWAQPCVRFDNFTGRDKDTYLGKCFIFLDGKLARMPTPHWATQAVYTPGQVWCPIGVSRDDVNPRPLSPDVPSNGLIGCYSADEKMIAAIAFEPYHELFQGVAACLHSDFRIGGLKPGESKKIRGKIYFLPADVNLLLKRYASDFPEQAKKE
jgi:hypothetical protein